MDMKQMSIAFTYDMHEDSETYLHQVAQGLVIMFVLGDNDARIFSMGSTALSFWILSTRAWAATHSFPSRKTWSSSSCCSSNSSAWASSAVSGAQGPGDREWGRSISQGRGLRPLEPVLQGLVLPRIKTGHLWGPLLSPAHLRMLKSPSQGDSPAGEGDSEAAATIIRIERNGLGPTGNGYNEEMGA
ncbi:uncharacterized protein LOC106996438 [Macaca mulatta]